MPIILLLILLLFPYSGIAQEEHDGAIEQSGHYINLKIKSLDKYDRCIKRQQDKLLKRLQKKEKRFARNLKTRDSLQYAVYQERQLSFDSIAKASKDDTGTIADELAIWPNESVDSLKAVQAFMTCKGSTTDIPVPRKGAELDKLQRKLNYRSYINELITQRTDELQLFSGPDTKIPGLKGIQKQVFYGKEKMNAFKAMQEDPTAAEEKAMEYLQGSKGFDQYMASGTQGGRGSMQSLAASGADASKLEELGYQTRRQMQANMSEQFGNGLGDVSKQMGSEVKEWQDKQKELGNITSAKQSAEQMRGVEKPSFKVNPMRGKPFRQRIEKQYSFETMRASTDGSEPATINPSGMVGFRHTPKLTYGAGIAASVGLGQSWQNIHFSFRGIGLRTFASWQWQYGLGAYAGYERMYKQFAFTGNNQENKTDIIPTPHNTRHYNESVLIGLSKSYTISKKYSGAMQLLYDVWWQQKGARSPIVLRFVTKSK